MDILVTDRLSKRYGSHTVFDQVSLRVPSGTIYGLVGPSGAGKTTFLQTVLGFRRPTRGSLRLLGSNNPEKMRLQVGYTPERLRYQPHWTGHSYLQVMAQLSHMDGAHAKQRVLDVLDLVDLADVAMRKISSYSKEMLVRLGLAQAILSSPEILIIDDPFSGLNIDSQRAITELLQILRADVNGMLVSATTLEHLPTLCDRIGFMVRRTLDAEADMALVHHLNESVMLVVDDLTLPVTDDLRAISPAVHVEATTINIRPNTPALQAQVIRVLLEAGSTILSLEAVERPLEHLYNRLLMGNDPDIDLSGRPLAAIPGTRIVPIVPIEPREPVEASIVDVEDESYPPTTRMDEPL